MIRGCLLNDKALILQNIFYKFENYFQFEKDT